MQELLDAGDSLVLQDIFTSKMILKKTTHLRKLFKSEKGYQGMASMYVELGDGICFLFGGWR